MRTPLGCMIVLQLAFIHNAAGEGKTPMAPDGADRIELTAPAYGKHLHVPARGTREFRLHHVHPGSEFFFIESTDGTPLQGRLELNEIQRPQDIQTWDMNGQAETAGLFTMLRKPDTAESWNDLRLTAGDRPLNFNFEYMLNPPPGYVGAKLENGELQSMTYASSRSTWLDVDAPAGARVSFRLWDGKPVAMRVYDTQAGDGGWNRLTQCDGTLDPGASCTFTTRSGKARVYVYGVDRTAHVSATW